MAAGVPITQDSKGAWFLRLGTLTARKTGRRCKSLFRITRALPDSSEFGKQRNRETEGNMLGRGTSLMPAPEHRYSSGGPVVGCTTVLSG